MKVKRNGRKSLESSNKEYLNYFDKIGVERGGKLNEENKW